MATDPGNPPSRERAKHYRALAGETLMMADAALSPDARSQFLQLALAWRGLALQAENNRGFQIQLPNMQANLMLSNTRWSRNQAGF